MNVTPLPTTTNAQDWEVTMSVYDDETEMGFDLTDYTVEVRLNDRNGGLIHSLTATKTLDDDSIESVVSWRIPVSIMGSLAKGSYGVAVRIVKTDSTRQILLGALPVISGGFE